jgi:hypothetical protein
VHNHLGRTLTLSCHPPRSFCRVYRRFQELVTFEFYPLRLAILRGSGSARTSDPSLGNEDASDIFSDASRALWAHFLPVVTQSACVAKWSSIIS